MRIYPIKYSKIANRFAEGFLKSGLSTDPSSDLNYYKILDENRLTGQQIKTLMFGRKIK